MNGQNGVIALLIAEFLSSIGRDTAATRQKDVPGWLL